MSNPSQLRPSFPTLLPEGEGNNPFVPMTKIEITEAFDKHFVQTGFVKLP